MMRMNSRIAIAVVALLCCSIYAVAQESGAEKMVRPRVVTPPVEQSATQNPATPAVPSLAPAAAEAPQKLAPGPIQHLTPSVIQTRISEAKRMLRTRPVTTAMSTPAIQFVTVAALEETAKIHFVTILKETFLTKGSEFNAITSLGTNVNVRILRANGVNTALTLLTPDGKSLAPLTVEYPIEKGGTFKEMAYYTSAHPALLSKDLVRSGQSYVRDMQISPPKRLNEKSARSDRRCRTSLRQSITIITYSLLDYASR